MQKAAIEEQLQLAKENSSVAAIAAAASSTPGQAIAQQSNMENLLDIDFDGSAPASLQKAPTSGSSGLEGLAGTPQRVASPAAGMPSNTMEDLMGVFGNGPSAPLAGASSSGGGLDDLMGGLNMNGASQPLPPQQQLQGKKQTTNDDILGLF
jgi:AP-1 complex subunit beta-1